VSASPEVAANITDQRHSGLQVVKAKVHSASKYVEVFYVQILVHQNCGLMVIVTQFAAVSFHQHAAKQFKFADASKLPQPTVNAGNLRSHLPSYAKQARKAAAKMCMQCL